MMLLQSSRTASASAATTRRAINSRQARPAVLRIRAEAPLTPEPVQPKPASTPVMAAATSGASVSQSTNLLGSVQEAINGRSAMLGFVAAVISESITHQSVWSQIAGKYANTQLVEAPEGNSALAYFAVVVLVTMASLMPKLIEDLNVDSKSFGPFTPGLESLLGRMAMIGFSGLMLVEAVKQSPLL